MRTVLSVPRGRNAVTLFVSLAFLGLAVAPLLTLAGLDAYVLTILTRIMVFAIAALSLDLILGFGAMVSFGHAAFLGIGAYAVGILSRHGITDIIAHGATALLVSGLFALATGALSLRTRGVYFIMITLAFGQMAFFFMVSMSAYGGDDGLTLAGRSTVLGAPVLENDTVLYYVALAILAGSYLFGRALVASRFGRVLRGTRESPVRMASIGFSPYRYQLTAYAVAGMIASLAGVLLANQAEFVSPAYMTWQRSGELIVMVVLGGMGTLHGAILGAGAFLLLEDWLAHATAHWKLVLGLILVLVVLFARGGILGLLRRAAEGRDR